MLTVSLAMENVTEILNSQAPPTDFSPEEHQRLAEKYLALSQENDRLVKAIRAGTRVDVEYMKQVFQTDFPLYVQLQDYFTRLRARESKSVGQSSSGPDDIVLGSTGGLTHSIDVNINGDSEMQLAPEGDHNAMSMFSSASESVFAERSPTVPNHGPFGIRFSDFPPRVISQMLSMHTGVAASSCRCSYTSLSPYTHGSFIASWRGTFKWAGFEHVSRARKFMSVPMIGMSSSNGKDLYAKLRRCLYAH